MKSVFEPGADLKGFLRRGQQHGYSMESPLFDPAIGKLISEELNEAEFLEDLVEQQPVASFKKYRMKVAYELHSVVNQAICELEGKKKNHLPYFSVRVFPAGEHATTVHRNHPYIGPWTVGITLSGEAPFSVYDQSVLDESWDHTIALTGNDTDPTPSDTMAATPGSGWTLYTAHEQMPHSGGLVNSDVQRELLILYGMY
jgi:hypothetical protein